MNSSLWNEPGTDLNYEYYRTNPSSIDLRTWADKVYYELNLAQYLDSNFLSVFSNNNFFARLWELELVEWLFLTGLDLIPTNGTGPDFCVVADGKRIWIEARMIFPDDGMVRRQRERITATPSRAYNTPIVDYTLRYSSGIAAKYRDKIIPYARQGIIKPEDYTLLAVSAFAPNAMDSHFDFFSRSVLPVGNQLVHIPVNGSPVPQNLPTHEMVNEYINRNGSLVAKNILMPGSEYPILDGVLFSEASNLQGLLGSWSSRYGEETNTPHIIPNFHTHINKPIPSSFTNCFYIHEWIPNPPGYRLERRDPFRHIQTANTTL